MQYRGTPRPGPSRGFAMKRHGQHLVFAAHLAFALVVVGLITADLVAAEAAATGGRMSPLNTVVVALR